LNGALLRAGLVDEINVELYPAVIGGFDTPALFDSPALQPDEWPTRLKLLSAQAGAGGRVWLRYQVVREQEG
jgi:riboflavin biosynthesis pyrimidine reductase